MEHGFISGMILVMEVLLNDYGAFTVAVSVFFLGENAALAIFALAGLGFISPVEAFLWAFVGSLLSDVFWFFIAEFVLRKHYEKRVKEAKQEESNRFFMRLIDNHFFWMLIFIKFMVGIRLILTIYIVLKNKIPFWKKVLLDSIGTFLFMGALFPVGWYLGKGNSESLSIEQGLERIITGIVLLIVISHLIMKFVPILIEKRKRAKHRKNAQVTDTK